MTLTVSDNAAEVAEHVICMQKKYSFKNDADTVRDAVVESAELLRIELVESEIVQACRTILGK